MLRLLSRLSIAEKLLLSGAAVVIPLLSFLYGYVLSARQTIDETEEESQAVEPLTLLSESVKAIYIYENLRSNALANNEDQEIARARDEVKKSLDRLSASANLELAEPVAELRKDWVMSAPADSNTKLDRTEARRRIADSIVLVARAIGDQYSLPADSNLDSYYLSVLAAFQLPRTVTILWNSALVSPSVGIKIPGTTLVALAAAAGSLQNGLIQDAEHSIDTALRLDKDFNGISSSLQRNLPKSRDLFMPVANACVQQIWAVATQHGETSSGALSHDCTLAGRAGVQLWTDCITELRILQEARINDLNRKYRTRLLFSSLGLIFALSLVAAVSLHTRRMLGTGIEVARLVAKGRIPYANQLLASSRVERLLKEFSADSTIRDEGFLLVRAMHRMIGRLENVSQRLNQANPAVAQAATQLREAIRNLEDTVSRQAQTTAMVSSIADRLSASNQASARAISAVARIANASAASATEGQEYLTRIRDGMSQLGEASQGLLETFGKVKERTVEVDRVITTIARIANRTNLISLNAVIEAEKSGNSASGFSVIAEEIQHLANQTGVAGQQIESLVREARMAVETGTETLRRYTSQARSSQEYVEEVSGELKQVMDAVQLFGPEFDAVNEGLRAQSDASRDITQSVLNLNAAAKRTAGAMAQCESVLAPLELALADVRSGIDSLAEKE